MLSREDRARLLRETVLKASVVEGDPTAHLADPADLQVPHNRRDRHAETLNLSRGVESQNKSEHVYS